MARLTGEAARKWLAENPGKGYFDNRTGKFIETERGAIGNFLMGVSKPFRTVLAAPLGIAADIATRARGEYDEYKSQPMALPFVSGGEAREIQEDPYLSMAKGAAGTASYFLPGGAAAGTSGLRAIGSAAARTGVSGLLSGFGYSPKGEELGSTLKGGLLGSVIGGGLQTVKEIPKMLRASGLDDIRTLRGKALKSAGVEDIDLNQGLGKSSVRSSYLDDIEKLQRGKKTEAAKEYLIALRDNGLVDPGQVNMSLEFDYGVKPGQVVTKVKPASDQATRELGLTKGTVDDLGGWGETKNFAAEFYDDASSFGAKKMNRYGRAEIHSQITSALDDEVQLALSQSDNLIDANKIVDALKNSNSLKLSGIGEEEIGVVKSILSKYADDAGKVTPSRLHDFVLEVQKAGGGFGGVVGDQAGKARQLLAATRELSRNELAKAAPEASDLLRKWSNYLATQPDMAAGIVSKSAGINIPATFQKVGGAGASKVMDTLAYPLSSRGGVSALGQIARPAATQGLGSGMSKALMVGQRAVPGIVGLVSGAELGQAGNTLERAAQGGTISEQEAASLMQSMGAQGGYTYQDAIQEAISIAPNASEAEILSWAKFLMDQNAGPERDTATISQVQQAISMIDEYGGRAAGKIATGTGKIGEFFGAAGPGTEYRSLISQIRTELIRYIAGTAQTPTEMKNLIDRLPQPTDEPQVAKTKLNVLLESLYGGNETQQTGIYDQYMDY